MSKHTPEPWSLNITKISGAITHWHIAGAKHGSAYPICNHTIEQEPSGDEQLANARLIAATPDLLEALRDMLSGWKYIRQQHGDLYGVGWDRAQDKAELAIAKAIGEQP